MKAIVSKCSVIFAKTFILLLSHFLYLLSLALPSTFPVQVHLCSLHITSFTHLLPHCFCPLPTSFNLSYYSSLNSYFLPLFCNPSCTFPSFHRNTFLSTAFQPLPKKGCKSINKSSTFFFLRNWITGKINLIPVFKTWFTPSALKPEAGSDHCKAKQNHFSCQSISLSRRFAL